MLLEIILYFSLGFLAAVLCVLIVAPTIWNRAVILTKQKVESSLPLSLNEIQAEKDKLRAEFAMTSRRLELGIEELRDKASEQAIELHSKRDEANKNSHENQQNAARVAKLEEAAGEMRIKLQENQENIDRLTTELSDTAQNLDETKARHEELQGKHSGTEEALNKTKIDLVASKNKADTLSATLATLNLSEDEQTIKIAALHEQIAQTKIELKEALHQNKASAMETRIATKKLQTTENKLEKLAAKSTGNSNAEAQLRQEVSDLTNQLIQENAKVIDLEAKLAQYMLRDVANGHVADRSAKLNSNLDALNTENQSLVTEIQKASGTNGMKPAQKRALKEKLRDIAAKTATSVSDSEGAESIISDLVKDNASKSSGKNDSTLIERIRKLQADWENEKR